MNNSSLKNFETDPTTNKIKMLKPAFFSCGCGSITSRLASVLQFVGVPSASLIKIRSKSHILARKWLEQENLYSKIPKLNNKVYGILIHPDGRYVDINDGAPIAVAKKFKEILNVSEPDKKS